MTIVSSEIFGVINKSGGRRKLLMQAVDDLGKVWETRPNVPADNDDAATLATWVAFLESGEGIVSFEKERIKNYIAEGGDPAGANSPYLTAQETAIAAVRGMMAAEDPLTIMPTAEYIQNNISNAQLLNWFGAEKGQRVRNRTDALVANKAFLIADKEAVEEV